MRLDKDPEMFRNIITNAALKQNILEVYVEKDYWLYLILKEIFKNNENGYVFKGGTSLSKCFRLINRFSEDIDISYSTSYEELTVGGVRKKFEDIIKAIEIVGLKVSNRENLRSRRYFNQFLCPYESMVEKQNDNIERKVIVELAAQTPSFPSETKAFSSFIYDYFKSINREDLIEKYDLEPFPIQVQTLERTLVDKTFAICDYYISDNIKQHSRHIYDISKLLSVINLNEGLAKLFLEVSIDILDDIERCVTETQLAVVDQCGDAVPVLGNPRNVHLARLDMLARHEVALQLIGTGGTAGLVATIVAGRSTIAGDVDHCDRRAFLLELTADVAEDPVEDSLVEAAGSHAADMQAVGQGDLAAEVELVGLMLVGIEDLNPVQLCMGRTDAMLADYALTDDGSRSSGNHHILRCHLTRLLLSSLTTVGCHTSHRRQYSI